MPLETPPAPPQAADLDAFDWHPWVGLDAGRCCDDLWTAATERFRVAEGLSERRVLRLLAHIAGLVLSNDKLNAPMRPKVPGLDVPALVAEDLEAIEAFLAHPDLHPDLRARLLDVRFLRRQGRSEEWQKVSTRYLEASKAMVEAGGIAGVPERLQRAMSLARAMRLDAERDNVGSYVTHLIDERAADNPTRDHLSLLRLGDALNEPDYPRLARIARGWAERATAEGGYRPWIRVLLYQAAEYFAKALLPEAERECRLLAAETHVQEADEAQKRPQMRYSAEAAFLEEAIQALRRIPDTAERRRELHSRMLEVQRQVPSEFARIQGPTLDLSGTAIASMDAVAGKELREALWQLVLFPLVPQRAQLRREAVSRSRENLFRYLMPLSTTDDEGRVVKRTPGGDLEGGDDHDAALLHAMHESSVFHRLCYVRGSINPARTRIAAEHIANVEAFADLLQDSPFVPQGRQVSFAVGLCAGLQGDLVTCGHVLVPQVEHAIRRALAARGAAVSTLGDDGIQQWTTLERLLVMPEAGAIFGEDHLFALLGLLSSEGTNLRNRVAHGLVDDQEFWSSEVMYLWWLTLRFCLMHTVLPGSDEPEEF